ncbi:MAG: ThuA domain-containing protein [Chloroflexi bacterium]|nr:MAG: ThuA domain-containing protein [Chloroflexota bacterium]
MRVLVLCDDYYHPAKVVRDGLGSMKDECFSFDFIDNANDWSAERMAQYPVVILSKSDSISQTDQHSWMSAETQQAFVDYVRQGKGLLAIHSGTAGYKEKTALRKLLGGVFDQHPAQCPVTVEPDLNHPLAAGSAPFTVKDEHYFMLMDREDLNVFMISKSEHGQQPAGWTRTEGEGRVCVLTPGHNLEVWTQPAFQAVIKNALNWCSKEA